MSYSGGLDLQNIKCDMLLTVDWNWQWFRRQQLLQCSAEYIRGWVLREVGYSICRLICLLLLRLTVSIIHSDTFHSQF